MSETERPCRCWVETWSQHEGHCCFSVDSPEDCHDAAGSALGRIHAGHSGRNGRGGPDRDRAFHLTRKGWVAAVLAQHPSLGRTW